jgi:hypothetical protein
MDHVVYVDAKAQELAKLLGGSKSMIIRGAAGRKLPYGRVETGDVLYLIENDGNGQVKAKAVVSSVFNSEKMDTMQSEALVANNQDGLQLTPAQTKRWAGKRYLVLISVTQVEALTPFVFDKSAYSNMDDWLVVEDIETVKIK